MNRNKKTLLAGTLSALLLAFGVATRVPLFDFAVHAGSENANNSLSSLARAERGRLTAPACVTDPIVITNADSGTGSLRQAIIDACAGSTITFDMTAGKITSPITLTSDELLLSKNLTFQGPGANLLTVQRSTAQGTPLFRIFDIVDQSVTTNISGLTLSNADSPENGGAIRNFGTLTLNAVTFSGNHTAAGGAAILNSSTGTVTLSNSTLSGNRSDFWAAIYNQGVTFTITNSTFSGNTNQQNFPGAAIFSEQFSLTNRYGAGQR